MLRLDVCLYTPRRPESLGNEEDVGQDIIASVNSLTRATRLLAPSTSADPSQQESVATRSASSTPPTQGQIPAAASTSTQTSYRFDSAEAAALVSRSSQSLGPTTDNVITSPSARAFDQANATAPTPRTKRPLGLENRPVIAVSSAHPPVDLEGPDTSVALLRTQADVSPARLSRPHM
ncbi:hypothetical protein BDZ85DRAFT_313611 [Elsinoe ampelina]|uniref:Uncharacterized protein n=1 Tax=Elsinoe ampelina TaxID=302913 RepID=A0A6A6GB32_9PEZI|nr:hypothetical protein BDZ85DRAFT_313611 [Elsinoe ampelina]